MTRIAHTVSAGAGLMMALAMPACAQGAAPCAGPEFRQLDFWVGEWDLSWDNPDGSVGQGHNSITRSEFGDCVIFEHFDGPGLVGISVSTYFAPMQVWRQTWVDDQGGYYALVGGPVEGEEYSFLFENSRLVETAPYARMIWQDVSADALVWRWQQKREAGDEWSDAWVIRYARAAAAE